MEIGALERSFAERAVTRVKLGGTDVDGLLRGKYISLDKFWSAARDGFGFCDVIFGWDAADALYDNVQVTGWHTGYPDTLARIDLGTFRMHPWEEGVATFLVDFHTADGQPHPACPRGLLKRVAERAHRLGYQAVASAEYEFFLFRETPHSLRGKAWTGLEPQSPGMFGYSWLRAAQNAPFVHALLTGCERFDLELEALHTETGPGVYEAAIRYDQLVRAADKAALFKTLAKETASRNGLTSTFMAKWNAGLPGCSGHLHQSLWDVHGERNLFHDPARPHGLSALLSAYVAGQLALLPDLCALAAPTVNSYKRFVPGVWAPINATWGIDNRTTALRAIGGPSGKSTRVEFRVAGADINAYVALAASVAAGLWGIERKLEPPLPVTGDAGARSDSTLLPRTLALAVDRLDRSEVAREILGEAFVDHYVRTRRWEVAQYDRAVTTWELERYFETV